MINLSDSAKKCLDEYLRKMRTCLRDCVTVDADEVERNVIEHIENELIGVLEPVSLENLDIVLKRLGSPSQWVPEEQIPWWRKVILRLHKGPEEWRLAYVSFVLFILAFLLVGRLSFIVLLLASFCTSRAVVSMAKEPDELRGKKWLIYQTLIVVYVPTFIFMFFWPVLPLQMLAHSLVRHEYTHYGMWGGLSNIAYNSSRFTAGGDILILLTIMGLWWIVLGIIGCLGPTLFKVIFRPFADNFKRKWAGLVLGIGLLLIIVCLGVWLLSNGLSGHFMHRSFF